MSFTKFATAVAALALLALPASAWSASLNDAEIAHIAYTAGAIDITAANQALHKSRNKEIRSFANEMVRDHTAVNKKALALVKKLGVKPQPNATSKALSTQAKKERAKLAKLSGPAFDKAYIDNEVAFHKEVDSALEKTLIPSSHNPQLKALLKTGLKIFQGHEQHAEQIAADMH